MWTQPGFKWRFSGDTSSHANWQEFSTTRPFKSLKQLAVSIDALDELVDDLHSKPLV